MAPTRRVSISSELTTHLVSKKYFAVLWFAAFLSHLISGMYLLFAGGCHYWMIGSNFAEITKATKQLGTVALLYVLVALLHLFKVLEMLVYSILQCGLSFGPVTIAPPRNSHTESAASSGPLRQRRWLGQRLLLPLNVLHRLLRKLRRLYRKYLSPYGLFGIFGPFYDQRVGLRELIDIPSHIYQAVSMSFYVDPALCLVVAFIVFLECFTHPILHHFMRHQSTFQRRATFVMIDVVLDVVLGAIIPVMLVIPLALQYVSDLTVINRNYSDSWYSIAVLRIQQTIVKSFLDFFTQVSPFAFNFWTLRTMGVLFSRHLQGGIGTVPQQPPEDTSVVHPIQVTSNTADETTQWAQAAHRPPERTEPDATASQPFKHFSFTESGSKQTVCQRGIKVFRWCFMLVGIAVLSVALITSGVILSRAGCPPGCLFQTAPWSSMDCHCVVQRFNCIEHNLTDAALAAAIDEYPQVELMVLVVNQCPALVMPAGIRRFTRLLGLSIYNSELVEWGVEAAVSADAFSFISYVLFIRTNISIVPPGLLQDLPASLSDIEIIASATTPVFPSSIAVKWANVSTLFLERCNLDTVPEPLLALGNMYQFSLAHNTLTVISDKAVESPLFRSVQFLILSANVMTSLPDGLSHAVNIAEMYVDNMAIASIAPLPSSTAAISTWNTTYCSFNTTKTVATNASISCTGLHHNIFRQGVVPLDADIRSERSPVFLSTLV